MTAPEELQYWVALNRIAGLGRVRYSLLQKHFPSMEEAWRAGVSELKAAGLDGKLAARVVAERAASSPDEGMERLGRDGGTAPPPRRSGAARWGGRGGRRPTAAKPPKR